MGYAIDGAYKMGQHWFTARYDMLNYNTGDDWYTATNPYMPVAGGDYSPKYTEITVGYNYVFNPAKYGAGKLKLDYVHRSKNFLPPARWPDRRAGWRFPRRLSDGRILIRARST